MARFLCPSCHRTIHAPEDREPCCPDCGEIAERQVRVLIPAIEPLDMTGRSGDSMYRMAFWVTILAIAFPLLAGGLGVAAVLVYAAIMNGGSIP